MGGRTGIRGACFRTCGASQGRYNASILGKRFPRVEFLVNIERIAVNVVEHHTWIVLKRAPPGHRWRAGFRPQVRARGSTRCGDEQPGGLSTPEDFARFAEKLVALGY